MPAPPSQTADVPSLARQARLAPDWSSKILQSWQTPAEHVPPPHEWPHAPQLAASVCVLVHAPPQ
jgi:hypothetical protein